MRGVVRGAIDLDGGGERGMGEGWVLGDDAG